MEIDYKHTWEIPRKKWYMRLFLWVYDAKEENVTFCKLFWGYAFMWLCLPLKLVALGMAVVAACIGVPTYMAFLGLRHVGGRMIAAFDRQVARENKTLPRQRIVVSRRSTMPAWTQQELASPTKRILTAVETAAAWTGMQVRRLSWSVVRPVGKKAGDACLALVDGVGLVGYSIGKAATSRSTRRVAGPVWNGIALTVGACLWLLEKGVWLTFWPVREALSRSERQLSALSYYAVLGMGVLVIAGYMVGTIWGLGYVIVNRPVVLAEALGGLLGVVLLCFGFWYLVFMIVERAAVPAVKCVTRPVLHTTGEKTIGFGRMMIIGYKAVKSNTCPRIEVKS